MDPIERGFLLIPPFRINRTFVFFLDRRGLHMLLFYKKKKKKRIIKIFFCFFWGDGKTVVDFSKLLSRILFFAHIRVILLRELAPSTLDIIL